MRPATVRGCHLPEGAAPPFLEFGSIPLYPISSSRKGEESTIALNYTVNTHGEVSLNTGLDDPQDYFFSHAAVAIQDWKMRPAKLNGTPITVQCRTMFYYRMEKDF
ncbi:energy transducer TonB [Sphaerotilus microaerophilus]|uniref:TonB C-terminal domain-containing protein n=1 Tax=Sphaerotilus microaerophilus TaxID=2914710 RepID=A0ABM7YM43_9BURK|nr:energy transducer TonB [Sphaerotilus sp. FB-5]BDI05517.1 hypothetical protein CATMQ487_24870 [Sphaerotilus sp. FB-5]